MTRDDVGRVVGYFLNRWGKTLAGRHAIPAILIGQGVDDHEGEYVLLCPKNEDMDSVAHLLRQVLAEIENDTAQVRQK